MTTLTEIAEGVENRLRTISDLYVYDHPAAVPNLPAAMFMPPSIDYRLAMKSNVAVVSIPAEVHVLVPHAAGHEAQKTKLWPYLDWAGDRSILLAIDGDKTLGISDKVNANVMSARLLGLDEYAHLQAFAAAIDLQILITNRE